MKLADIITFIYFADMISIYGEDIPYIEDCPKDIRFSPYYSRDIEDIRSDNDIIAIKNTTKGDIKQWREMSYHQLLLEY